ncbi:MAG: alpha/beta hydrolase, partial [Armatimonadota bacterium]
LNAQFLPDVFLPNARAQLRADIEARQREIIARMPQATYDAIWSSVRDFNAVPWLPQIRCPVLAIYGGRGRYRPGEAEVLRQQLRLPRIGGPAQVVVVAGAGHFVNLERPRETNAAIVGWVKEHFGAPVI